MMITEQTRIVLHKKIDVVDMAGEKVMADFDTGKYYMLKGAANDIWDNIQTEISVGELVGKLMESFEIDRGTCLESTVSFLEQLRQNGFIELK